MSKHRHGGKNNRSFGGSAGGGNKQGKLLYNSGDEPAFIKQFKERAGYKAPSTTDDKHRIAVNEMTEDNEDERRKDDEKPQIVQLNANDLSKEEVEIELAKAREVEEEKKCVDSTGRLLFRKPKEKLNESDATTSKSDIIEMASNKTNKRKHTTPSTNTHKESHQQNLNETKKTKTQLLSFMDESGFDGDD